MNNFLDSLWNRKGVKQLFRYGIVGIMTNAVGYAVYLLVTYIGVPPKFTMSVLYAVGATIGYFGNSSFTFSYKGGRMGSGARYVVTHFTGYVMNLGILIVFVDRLGYPHQFVQIVAIFVVAVFLFTAFKYYVFRPTNTPMAGGKA